MYTVVVIRKSDMKPVLECWNYELEGKVLKDEYLVFSSLDWLRAFNQAVKLAGGVQPTMEQIRKFLT
jgi:hypothetical protein